MYRSSHLVSLSALLIAFSLGACDSRPLPSQGDDQGPGGVDAGFADTVAPPVPWPPAPPPTCSPTDDPVLSVSLAREGKDVIARVTNVGCTTAYRWQGCCGEGDPMVESLIGGLWKPALCAPGPGLCCDAEPSCVPLLPGESVALRVPGLSAEVCCGTTFRVTLPYSREPGCIEDAMKVALVATSNALKLRDKDPCGTPCGSSGVSCKIDTEVCVIDQGWAESASCKPVPADCVNQRDCACLGKALCNDAFNLCIDSALPNTISCECPNC